MNTISTKASLRKTLLSKRQSLPPSEVSKRSEALVAKLKQQIDFREIKNVHCFLPLKNDKEPDLRELIEFALQNGVTVYTSNPKQPVLHLENQDETSLKQFKLGDSVVFDLIVVPILGFNGLHRLGFGGGFYDRLLGKQTRAKKIGVCFSEFEIAELPVEPHDQPLDQILTV